MRHALALIVVLLSLTAHASASAECETLRELSAPPQRLRIELCHEARGTLSVVVLDAQGSEVGRLQDHVANTWAPTSLRSTRLVDVNHDGLRDLVVCASAMSGTGPEGAREFPICDFWLASADSFVRADRVPEWTRQETHLVRLVSRLQRFFSPRHRGE